MKTLIKNTRTQISLDSPVPSQKQPSACHREDLNTPSHWRALWIDCTVWVRLNSALLFSLSLDCHTEQNTVKKWEPEEIKDHDMCQQWRYNHKITFTHHIFFCPAILTYYDYYSSNELLNSWVSLYMPSWQRQNEEGASGSRFSAPIIQLLWTLLSKWNLG